MDATERSEFTIGVRQFSSNLHEWLRVTFEENVDDAAGDLLEAVTALIRSTESFRLRFEQFLRTVPDGACVQEMNTALLENQLGGLIAEMAGSFETVQEVARECESRGTRSQ